MISLVIFVYFKLDGAEQVCFAQPRTAPDEQGVVCPRRVGRDSLRGGIGKFVGGTDDEIFKGKLIAAARPALPRGALRGVLFGGWELELNAHIKA